MPLRWVGPPPTKTELRVLQNAARAGKLPKHGTVSRSTMAKAGPAAVAYKAFHWGDAPKKAKRVKLPNYSHGIYALGKLRAVEYETVKGGEHAVWVHQFEEPYPTLTGTPGGKLGPIVGGGHFITERGIER